jgi:hypothetical protein
MSLSFTNRENTLPPSPLWADIPGIFDQSASVDVASFGDIDWVSTNMKGDSQPIEQRAVRFPNSTSLVNSIYVESEASLSSSPPGENHGLHVESGREKSRGIGRPKLKLKGDQTATDVGLRCNTSSNRR